MCERASERVIFFFNRTSLELKRVVIAAGGGGASTFNRTSLELKPNIAN